MSFDRRRFLRIAGAGAGLAVFPEALSGAGPEMHTHSLETGCIELHSGWLFRMDIAASMTPEQASTDKEGWMPVNVPHTWQSLLGGSNPAGVGWYQRALPEAAALRGQHSRLEFEAATHSAQVWLNGKSIGEHIGKGYTAFTCDLGDALHPHGSNLIMVRVDNRPSDTMLPRNKSYDWTDDGGLIRPVNLLVTPDVFLERLEIDAVPHLESPGSQRTATITLRAHVSNAGRQSQKLQLSALLQPEGRPEPLGLLPTVNAVVPGRSSVVVAFPPYTLVEPQLWHVDTPHLYSASVTLESSAGRHVARDIFGVRSFEVRGTDFFLNGEKVSLMGVERMAGSHPDFGMAESTDWICANHADMKELNCLYTRVHWPQDRRVLDFCDRRGILMQEEVPAWGPQTFLNTTDAVQAALERNGLEQLQEMVARDRNHPCIVTWGLCNEVDGKNPRARQFAHRMGDEARRLDPSRLQTYASHTLGTDPGADMAGDFDFISTNEYYGSWTPGGPPQVEAHLERIRKAFPNTPIVVSEYGWCECQPSIMPGDDNRVDIVNSHTDVFRRRGDVAGAIYFDYNDYRTLVGDKGTGPMQQRVHGVVDLYARRKPSFAALRRECSPIASMRLQHEADQTFSLRVASRTALPAYTLKGYTVRWVFYGYDDLPMGGAMQALPSLKPGEQHDLKANCLVDAVRRVVIDVLRPQGQSVAQAEWLGEVALR